MLDSILICASVFKGVGSIIQGLLTSLSFFLRHSDLKIYICAIPLIYHLFTRAISCLNKIVMPMSIENFQGKRVPPYIILNVTM